jgi:hypothetical protein
VEVPPDPLGRSSGNHCYSDRNHHSQCELNPQGSVPSWREPLPDGREVIGQQRQKAGDKPDQPKGVRDEQAQEREQAGRTETR